MNKVRLGEICKPKQWKTLTGKELISNGKYPVYGANGIIGYYNEYNHEKETLLIGCRGTCGALNICVNKSYVNGNAMALDNLREDIDVKFLYYALMGRGLKDIISGAVQPQIIRSDLEKIEVLIGTKAEQKDIIEKFDAIESVISLRRKELEKLDELIKARFVELFGDPVTNERGWDTKPLEEACYSIVDCPHSTPSYTTDDTEFMCIRTSIVKKNQILWDEIEYIPEEEYVKRIQRKKPEKGDVIYTREGAILGIAAVIDRDCDVALGQRLMLLSPDQKQCMPEFLSMAMNCDSFLNNALKGMSGSASPHINVGDIRVFNMIMPPIELQKQFSEFTSQVDKSKVVALKAA